MHWEKLDNEVKVNNLCDHLSEDFFALWITKAPGTELGCAAIWQLYANCYRMKNKTKQLLTTEKH